MKNNQKLAVLIPVFNEGSQIEHTIKTLPDYLDKIVVINDCSKDDTEKVVLKISQDEPRLVLINHERNKGVGAAMISGYKWARDNDMDIAIRMDGDGQMDPRDLDVLIDSVLNGQADYTKGNRLFTGEAYRKIPKVRYFGNSVLSLLTKIASGYWHVTDSQTGYTVINKAALKVINWDKMYQKYGQPNDLLVRLNVYNFKVKDVPITPVYNVGEKSGLKIYKVIFTIPWLLFRLFLWRMKEKYIIRDFHPLVFFYFLGWAFGFLTIALFARLAIVWYETGHIPAINALSAMFSFMSSSLFTLFAMWFDMESNKDLKA